MCTDHGVAAGPASPVQLERGQMKQTKGNNQNVPTRRLDKAAEGRAPAGNGHVCGTKVSLLRLLLEPPDLTSPANRLTHSPLTLAPNGESSRGS